MTLGSHANTGAMATKSAIDAALGALGAKVTATDKGKYWHFVLSVPSGSEYGFEIYLYDHGEPQISAKRVGVPDDTGFWYDPFEIAGYDSSEQRDAAFFDILRTLLTHKTRITISQGFFLRSLTCQYFDPSKESWMPIGALGGSFGLATSRKKLVLHAGATASDLVAV